MDIICLLIVSTCILHNICILNGDEADDLIDLEQELEEERLLHENGVDYGYERGYHY